MNKKKLTVEAENYILANYKGCTVREMSLQIEQAFGIRVSCAVVQNYYKANGLKSGLTGRWTKGQVAWNKGKSWKIWMSSKGAEKVLKNTSFQKGHIPAHKYREVGSERIDKRDGFVKIKLADPNVWQLKHRYVWEQVHGKVPDGMVITFLDGNKQNCNIENLMLITRNENVRLNQNSLRFENTEVGRVAVNMVRLECAVRDRRRKENGKTHKSGRS